MINKKTIRVNNLDDTKVLAKNLANIVEPNVYLLLSGDLGAGKTTFTKELLKNAGVTKPVTSPTFVILNQYLTEDGLNVNHMDAYRLNSNEELDMYLEQFDNAFNIIEWWQNIDLDLDNIKWIKVNISRVSDNSRDFEIERNF